MEKLLASVQAIVPEEYNRATARFGPTNVGGDHHSYGVIKEEVEEAQDELEDVKTFFQGFWSMCKGNSTPQMKRESLRLLKLHAELGAAELIQVAAMAHKAMITIEERGKNVSSWD